MFNRFFASNSFTGIAGFLLLGGVALAVFWNFRQRLYKRRRSSTGEK